MISSYYVRCIINTRGPRAARYEVRAAWRAGTTGYRTGLLPVVEHDAMQRLVQWLVDDYVELCRRKRERHQIYVFQGLPKGLTIDIG